MVTAAGFHDRLQGLAPKLPDCPKCKAEFGYRVRRALVFKTIFNWLPLKRYYCYRCKNKRYVWR